MPLVKRWSHSSLYCLQQCGEKFRRRYIDKDRRPSGYKAHRGTAIHSVAAESHNRQLAAKEGVQDRELSAILVEALPSKEEAEDLAATSFSNAISDKGVEVSKEEIAEYGSEDALRGACLDFAVHGSAHYVEKSAPRVNPTFVEKKVVYERPLEDHAVIGYIDLVEGEEGDRTIADLKTSEKRPSAWAAEDSGQLSTYATLWKLVMGELPKKLRLEYLVRTKKTKTTSMQRLETERNDGDVEATLNILDAAVQTVEAGAYMPTNPDNWWCSRKFCEYYSDCPYVNSTRIGV